MEKIDKQYVTNLYEEKLAYVKRMYGKSINPYRDNMWAIAKVREKILYKIIVLDRYYNVDIFPTKQNLIESGIVSKEFLNAREKIREQAKQLAQTNDFLRVSYNDGFFTKKNLKKVIANYINDMLEIAY